ncbi:MAG: transcription antitermination factor NusB [Rhodospirillales bacterium]|nr:transcription antitermination factor NusB [Rhodospirillales bacterium]
MTTPTESEIEKGGNRRSAARLAAVQALYEMDMVDADADAVLEEFLRKRWSLDKNSDRGMPGTPGVSGAVAAYLNDDEVMGEDTPLTEPDREWLGDVVHGVAANRNELDAPIAPALSEKWTIDRLETLIRVILRAATFELKNKPSVPASVIINEYLDVAHAFFEGPETGLINGVLDRLARDLRS